MAAENGDAGLRRNRGAAFENAGENFQRQGLGGKCRDVECSDRLRAHRVNIRECVRCSDAAEVVRVVDDRRKEVDGLHDREIVAHAKDARIVVHSETDEHAWIDRKRETAQNLRQVGRADFTRSTAERRVVGEANVLGGVHGGHIQRNAW